VIKAPSSDEDDSEIIHYNYVRTRLPSIRRGDILSRFYLAQSATPLAGPRSPWKLSKGLNYIVPNTTRTFHKLW
jgi:hypothetical protein